MTRVEILYFDGCPNHEPARALVERVAAELRFLGSPTVRVDGRDVEPGAAARHEFVLSCRVYRTEQGLAGQPDEAWIREALTGAAS